MIYLCQSEASIQPHLDVQQRVGDVEPGVEVRDVIGARCLQSYELVLNFVGSVRSSRNANFLLFVRSLVWMVQGCLELSIFISLSLIFKQSSSFKLLSQLCLRSLSALA